MKVGFIGVGNQGGPMARRVAESGYPLTLWARRRASLEAFDDLTFDVASSPAELGAAVDLVGICVVGDSDVDEVVLGGEVVVVVFLGSVLVGAEEDVVVA